MSEVIKDENGKYIHLNEYMDASLFKAVRRATNAIEKGCDKEGSIRDSAIRCSVPMVKIAPLVEQYFERKAYNESIDKKLSIGFAEEPVPHTDESEMILVRPSKGKQSYEKNTAVIKISNTSNRTKVTVTFYKNTFERLGLERMSFGFLGERLYFVSDTNGFKVITQKSGRAFVRVEGNKSFLFSEFCGEREVRFDKSNGRYYIEK